METLNDITAPEPGIKKRPDFLSVICILSLIWEGIVLLCLIVVLCLSNWIFSIIENFTATDQYEKMSEMQKQGIEQIMSLGQSTFAILVGLGILFTIVSIFGVVRMWKLKKSGFYIYTVVNGLTVIGNIIQLNFFMAIVGVSFIVMYGLNMKHMKR